LSFRFKSSYPNLPRRYARSGGNTEFTVYRERDNPRKFFVFEEYLDEASFQMHINAEYGAVFNHQLSHRRGRLSADLLTRSDPP
jgi:quinol monooxygenase YgiN